MLKSVRVYPENMPWPLTNQDITQLKQTVAKDSPDVWQTNDFTIKNIQIVDQSIFKRDDFFNSHVGIDQRLYYFSAPLYNSNKSYALFMYNQTFFPQGNAAHGVVIMKEEAGTWRQTGILTEDIYD